MKVSKSKKRVKFDLNRNKKVMFNENDNLNEDTNDHNETIDGNSNENSDELVEHKQSLHRLKQKDPEFYKFLKENDQQLLDFNEEDNDEHIDDDINDEDLDETDSTIDKLTLKQIDEWSDRLKQSANTETIKSVMKAFRDAINQTRDDSNVRLESTQIFNAIVNVCLIDLLPAIHKYLRLPQLSESKQIDPKRSRNWKNLVFPMKSYLSDVIKMLNTVSDNSLKLTIFRHILHLVPYYLIYSHLTKKLVKEAILLWSESEEKIRVIAFLCILRIIKQQQQRPVISQILKMLYISYVKNCKFTNESNWPLINFMKLGLVELYSLDDGVAYHHSFVFIKQLAINLRTAITVKKKESYKSIYNWQYLHSILFWSHLLSSLQQNDDLKSMLSALINVIIGTIKFAPSNNYLPLRLQLIKALIKLSDETNTYIPILPFITEILDHLVYNKKQSINSEKQLNLEVLLKISKLNVHNLEYRDAIINKVYELVLLYTSTQSYRIGFPELVFVSIIKIKKFIKSCSVANHCQLLKQLVEKIEENAKFVSDRRRNVIFSVKDVAIEGWERQLKDEGTPLLIFYRQWSKMKLQKESAKSDSSLIETNQQLNNSNIKGNIKNKNKRKRNESNADHGNKKMSKKLKRLRRKPDVTNNIEYSIDNAFNLSSDEEM